MQTKKKWMVVLTDEQYTWIKDTSEKVHVSGATVLRALVSEAMKHNSADFRRSLQTVQYEAELRALEEKEEQIAAKKKELSLKMGTRERVLA